MTTYYVNCYTVNRAYGGPEEGGWFFDVGIFKSSVSRNMYASGSEEIATALRDRLQELADTVQDTGPEAYLHDVSSVCCEGREVWMVEEIPGQDYPTHKPCYE